MIPRLVPFVSKKGRIVEADDDVALFDKFGTVLRRFRVSNHYSLFVMTITPMSGESVIGTYPRLRSG
jgi:hypothetical protein